MQKAVASAVKTRAKDMGASDWYVWVVGAFGAFVFDVTMNNARIFQMLANLAHSMV
jgi:hypothetical protein